MLLTGTIATAIFSGALAGPLSKTLFFADSIKYVKPNYTMVEPYILKLPPPTTPKSAKTATPLLRLQQRKK
jgi:protein TonB